MSASHASHQKGQPHSSLLRQGWPTFFGAPTCLDLAELRSEIAILGVPFDMATNDRPGSRFGPLYVRDASMRFQEIDRDGWFDLESETQVLRGVRIVDCGDVDIRTVDLASNFDLITETVKRIRQATAFPVLVGGDHTVTYAALRAYEGLRIQVVDFDAHLDFTDRWKGQEFSHDNWVRRASELPGIEGTTELGIRGLLERTEPYRDAVAAGVQIITALRLTTQRAAEVVSGIPDADAYYVSVDVDVLDPGIAPGTGYPEPGGLSYYLLRDLLIQMARKGKVVGFDLAEVNPLYDPGSVTCRISARLVIDFLGALFSNQP